MRQRVVLGAGLEVDDDRVPLGERAAAAVLAAEPDRGAFQHQRAERQRLAGAPVDGLRLLMLSRPRREDLEQVRVRR